MINNYTELAIKDVDNLVFGQAPHPVTTKSGMVIGGGTVYPELNFTLPPMEVAAETLTEVKAEFTEMIEGACYRAAELHTPGLVVEFELLPPMTLEPEWGADITHILRATLDKYAKSDGLESALRVTPNDMEPMLFWPSPPSMKGPPTLLAIETSSRNCAVERKPLD